MFEKKNSKNMTSHQRTLNSQITLGSKSILAKLMASENLTVEHSSVATTAVFDLKRRKLTLPLWDVMSEDVYNMLIAHEISHALYTPLKGWMDTLNKMVPEVPETATDAEKQANMIHRKIAQSYLNVVEDARIEKIIKRKFPGVTSIFFRAYHELYDQGVFVEEGTDISKLTLIDRLNLRAKIGIHCGNEIPLEDSEIPYWEEMLDLEKWEDTVALTEKIYKFVQDPVNGYCDIEMQSKMPPMFSEGGNNGKDEDDDDGEGKGKGKPKDGIPSKGKGKGKGKRGKSVTDMDSDVDLNDCERVEGSCEEGEECEGSGSVGQSQSSPEVKAESKNNIPTSITDGRYVQFKENIPKSTQTINYVDIDRVDTDNVIVPYPVVLEEWKATLTSLGEGFTTGVYTEFKKTSRDYVNSLVSAFDIKKAATAHSRTATSITGKIDLKRLHTFKYNEDIFARNTTIKNGKSHGMVLYIDWSSSMSNDMYSTIMQLLNLVHFCKKANLPFVVYAFSNGYHSQSGENKKKNLTTGRSETAGVLTNYNLIEFMSSRMKANEFNVANQILLSYAHMCSGYKHLPEYVKKPNCGSIPGGYDLNGTPLNEAIVSAFNIVPKFQSETKCEIVNMIVLTDGEASYVIRSNRGSSSNLITYRDKSTRSQVCVDVSDRSCESTKGLIKLVRHHTNCNAVGFFLTPTEDGKRILASVAGYDQTDKNYAKETEALAHKFKTDNYVEFNNWGYNSYFCIPSVILDKSLVSKQLKVCNTLAPVDITQTFTADMISKKKARVVLGRFIDVISPEAKKVKVDKAVF